MNSYHVQLLLLGLVGVDATFPSVEGIRAINGTADFDEIFNRQHLAASCKSPPNREH